MVSSSRALGAVGAVKTFPNRISIAGAILDRLPQDCLLVDERAKLFAQERILK